MTIVGLGKRYHITENENERPKGDTLCRQGAQEKDKRTMEIVRKGKVEENGK